MSHSAELNPNIFNVFIKPPVIKSENKQSLNQRIEGDMKAVDNKLHIILTSLPPQISS